MTHIKRFNETKEEKAKDQEMEFNADSLEMEKDLNPDIKTEPVEHDEKELEKVKKNKIEKFKESFEDENSEAKVKVKDLVEYLQSLDPEMEVYLDKDGWEYYETGIETVKNSYLFHVFTHGGKSSLFINN